MLSLRKLVGFAGSEASHPSLFVKTFHVFFDVDLDVNALDRCVPGYV
jgi:hypothetical protein